jgi:hypothetical protein
LISKTSKKERAVLYDTALFEPEEVWKQRKPAYSADDAMSAVDAGRRRLTQERKD